MKVTFSPVKFQHNYLTASGITNYQPANITYDNKLHSGTYNPVYYAPYNTSKISFGKKGFESHFPTDILGMTEDEYDRKMMETLNNPQKRALLQNYVLNNNNDYKTTDIINTWKQQIPVLISPDLITSVSGSGIDNIIETISKTAARNSVNSSFTKFAQSDYSAEILKKDGKSAAYSGLSALMFHLGSLDPEPHTKIAFLTLAAVLSGIGYSERSKDTQKILNKQFIDATKEMLRYGALDPYTLANIISGSKINLSDTQKTKYIDWLEHRKLELRYQRTGSCIDTHNDFDTEEGYNVLKKVSQVLSEDFNFNSEDLSMMYYLIASKYKAVGETQEAQFMTELAYKAQQQAYGENNPKLLKILNALIEIKLQNNAFSSAYKTMDDIDRIVMANYEPGSKEFFDMSLQYIDIMNKHLKHIDEVMPFVQFDHFASVGGNRKAELEKTLQNLQAYKRNCYTMIHHNFHNAVVSLNDNPKITTEDFYHLLDVISDSPKEIIHDVGGQLAGTQDNSLAAMLFGGEIEPNYTRLGKQCQNLLADLRNPAFADKIKINNNIKRYQTAINIFGDFEYIDKMKEIFGDNSYEYCSTLNDLSQLSESYQNPHLIKYISQQFLYNSNVRTNIMPNYTVNSELLEAARNIGEKEPMLLIVLSDKLAQLGDKTKNKYIKEEVIPESLMSYALSYRNNYMKKEEGYGTLVETVAALTKAIELSPHPEKYITCLLNVITQIRDNVTLVYKQPNAQAPIYTSMSEQERAYVRSLIFYNNDKNNNLEKLAYEYSGPFRVNERFFLSLKLRDTLLEPYAQQKLNKLKADMLNTEKNVDTYKIK